MSGSHEIDGWPSQNVSFDSCFDIVDAESNYDATQLHLSQHQSCTGDASTLNNSASTLSTESIWEPAFAAHSVPTCKRNETKNTTVMEATLHQTCLSSVASSFLKGASNPEQAMKESMESQAQLPSQKEADICDQLHQKPHSTVKMRRKWTTLETQLFIQALDKFGPPDVCTDAVSGRTSIRLEPVSSTTAFF